MKSDADQPGVGPPDVEPGRFANFMSAQGDHAFKRFTPLEPAADSTVESACGADRRQTLYTTLLSSAAAFESPQVSGVLQTAVADFTLGVIQGVQDAETVEASDEDDPIDFDSDDTSDEEDAAAPTRRTLAQKKDVAPCSYAHVCVSVCRGRGSFVAVVSVYAHVCVSVCRGRGSFVAVVL